MHEQRYGMHICLLSSSTLSVIHQFCEQVREEVATHVQGTYKETDLFKLFQTGAHHVHTCDAHMCVCARARVCALV